MIFQVNQKKELVVIAHCVRARRTRPKGSRIHWRRQQINQLYKFTNQLYKLDFFFFFVNNKLDFCFPKKNEFQLIVHLSETS